MYMAFCPWQYLFLRAQPAISKHAQEFSFKGAQFLKCAAGRYRFFLACITQWKQIDTWRFFLACITQWKQFNTWRDPLHYSYCFISRHLCSQGNCVTDPFTSQPVCDCQLDPEGLGRYSDIDCGAPRLNSMGVPHFTLNSVAPYVGPQVFHHFSIYSCLCMLTSVLWIYGIWVDREEEHSLHWRDLESIELFPASIWFRSLQTFSQRTPLSAAFFRSSWSSLLHTCSI